MRKPSPASLGERLPRFKLDRLIGQYFACGLIEILLANDQFGNITVEPSIGRHIIAILTIILAPTVLHLPTVRTPVSIQIHASQRHGMIAWAIAILQSLGLVEREFRTEKLVNAHGIAIKIAIADATRTACNHKRTKSDDRH